ncbi:MAG: tRNA (guanosine(46)-N7)-methyltransferase TrmB [bacterium]
MSYSYIIFPINLYQKLYSLNVNDNFIKISRDTNYIAHLVFEKITYVVLEIGFGDGKFIIEYAKDNQDKQIIGIEKSDYLVKHVAKKLTKEGINNVRLISSMANFAIYFLVPENFLDLIIVNFPDPWPKKAHISRRLLNPNFFKMIYPKMKQNSKIFISTDVEKYKDYILDSIDTVNSHKPLFKVENVFLGFWYEKYQTKYLNKWLKVGKKIFSIEITRK